MGEQRAEAETSFRPKIGDVVRLRSGGPPMTVLLQGSQGTYADGIARVCCCWFYQGGYYEGDVPLAALIPY